MSQTVLARRGIGSLIEGIMEGDPVAIGIAIGVPVLMVGIWLWQSKANKNKGRSFAQALGCTDYEESHKSDRGTGVFMFRGSKYDMNFEIEGVKGISDEKFHTVVTLELPGSATWLEVQPKLTESKPLLDAANKVLAVEGGVELIFDGLGGDAEVVDTLLREVSEASKA